MRFDVGGAVAYEGDPAEPLAGVSVALIDIDGVELTATTGSYGLWTITGLAPGVYFERFRLAGYEDVEGQFSLDAFGENDVANPFVSRPTVLMREEPLRATVNPFAVEIVDGDDLYDGLGGVAAVYDVSVGEDIVVAFSIPLVGAGYAVLEDGVTSELVLGVLDSNSGASFTLSGAEIAAMNGGTGLTADSNSQTRHTLFLSGDAVTPIHGTLESLLASLHFNSVP